MGSVTEHTQTGTLLNKLLTPGETLQVLHFSLVDRNQVVSTASKCQKKKQEQETKNREQAIY